MSSIKVGSEMHELGKRLFPINRSLTGAGVRETLSILKEELPALEVLSVPSGTQVFDWVVPNEWTIHDAYVLNSQGERVIDFQANNLHVVGYSVPIKETFSREELFKKLYTLPEQPDAIPYITSYYSENWGFCTSENHKNTLPDDTYEVVIDSELKPGCLNYAELIIPGESDKEVFISTYICHPSMANNELSGPLVTTYIAKWLMQQDSLKYTYRIVFIPETIGSVVYLSKHHEHLKNNVVAGFNVTCIGDDKTYSYLPSRTGNTLSDKAATHTLRHLYPDYKSYSWLDRGSDERQYCAPGIDLPIATIMRSKYGEYPEYHTSLDDLTFVTPSGLEGGYIALRNAIYIVEKDFIPKMTVLCEPQLGKRGLYPNTSSKDTKSKVAAMMDMISYCDGSMSLLEIANKIDQPFSKLYPICEQFIEAGLIEIFKEK
ncbi:DUF4910 domain-containing protein [Vibrio aquimaris]|uniref:Polysaccharide biosynthesis protein with aminopeptidase-like domain protein n=1 Tax=Vibrio aquimaris TaxID=2587862 RepID=A0A5P9CFA3_9VIBR|nr:DUF4910 domain-containing protein [Vibrio aquimaris]QFT24866.1 hypothetical protein FIV01_00100 [Vibrio aquimaris]